jgi:hypothetical protein
MAADNNGSRRVFSFPKPFANSLFPESGAVATADARPVLNNGSGLFNVPFTRNNAQKTRLEAADLQSTPCLQGLQGPIESKATPDLHQDFSGLQGFSCAHVPVSLPQLPQPSVAVPFFSLAGPKAKNTNTPKASNLLFAAPNFDSVAANLPNTISQTEPHQALLQPADFPTNGTGRPQRVLQQKKPLHVLNKAAFARSSTPAQDPAEVDSASPDYGVVQALMVAQGKKDRLLKEKVRKSTGLSCARGSRVNLPNAGNCLMSS